MRHLQDDEFLDVVEGARNEASFPHLAVCAECRRELADLREVMLATRDVEVPEPSPLFWDHLSSRVSVAVAAEPADQSWFGSWSWKIGVPVTVGLVALLLVVGNIRRMPNVDPVDPIASVAEAPAVETPTDGLLASSDDPSWNLMTDLAADLDWDSAIEAGIGAPEGGVDRAVFEMSAGERQELHRLLREELERSGV